MQATEVSTATQTAPSSLAMSRDYYLTDLLRPHRYAPGKNSFLFQTLNKGQRKTVLELSGSGSVRHLWSTWSIPGSDAVPTGRVLLRVFVDKQTTPSIVGTVGELCRAAQATNSSFVPFPAFIYKDAYNFYLPIYFSNGIRIEVEALDEINEFYTQIDYRLDQHERHSTRLVSELTPTGLILRYTGNALASKKQEIVPTKLPDATVNKQCAQSTKPCEFKIDGPGVIRKLTFRGEFPPDLQLTIYWDDNPNPGVQAPTKYLFADFINAAMESKPGEMTCYFPMPFRQKARIVLSSTSKGPLHIVVDYALERKSVSKETAYFHALFSDMQKTLGYSQFPILQIRGRGLFVGMNLFDSGHNHGGGDAALIDAGTTHPRVLHGICGEDYFGFAWHHVGTMTPLTGAPIHERRYRLHLENPYPFSESIQFLFGTFAGLQPKSVAFWYEFPKTSRHQWTGLEAPWKVLGPLGPKTLLPKALDDQGYETAVAINKPTQFTARWQDAQMLSGFLDLTYQFRHYALTESGSGFVAGTSTTKLTTYIYSCSDKTVSAILGHDDAVLVQANGVTLSDLSQNYGFAPSSLFIPLRTGWNTLDLILSNDENTNWRWSGLSLALQSGHNQVGSLTFSAELPPISSSPSQFKECQPTAHLKKGEKVAANF
ncbi:MAG TPA: DUF2961 domain-containing protein [Edaphobacter sp.]